MHFVLRTSISAVKVLALVCAMAIASQVPMVTNLFGDSRHHLEAPEDCNGQGVVDEIRPDGVVINDIYYRLIPGVDIINTDERQPSRRNIIKGDAVAFWLNSQGRIRAFYFLRARE